MLQYPASISTLRVTNLDHYYHVILTTLKLETQKPLDICLQTGWT
jgi:hypothetical protein